MMNQTVYIPFNQKLAPGNATFTLEIDKEYLENPTRKFSFATVTLVPDFYNSTVLDHDKNVSESVYHEKVVDYYFIENIVKENLYDASVYTPFTTPLSIPEVLTHLNKFAEEIKPKGHLLPPFFFDWVHKDAINFHGLDQFNFDVRYCPQYYGETYNHNKHAVFLPEYMRSLNVDFNTFIFPTNRDIWKDIRVRFTVMPNVNCYFSNDSLFLALGFDDEQSRWGNHVKSFKYLNLKDDKTWPVVAHLPPKTDAFVSNTIVRVKSQHSFGQSPRYVFETHKEHSHEPELIAMDYLRSLSHAALEMNLDVSIKYNESERRIFFTFPDNEKINVILRVSPQFAYNLGYGHVRQITKHMTSLPQLPVVDYKNFSQLSRTVTLDTGIVLVQLGRNNKIMAILEPQTGRYLTTKKMKEDFWTFVPQFNSTLEFVLSTFDDANRLMLLDWRSGGFIRGVLMGRV